MSRIHAGECEHVDMEWYGVDRQGNVAVFCSGGVGNLPEFVCENHERADELIDYFEMLEKMTSSVLMFHQSKGEEQCARNFSDKGLMLSRLVDTFFSRTSWTMLLYAENHSISVA